MKPLVSVIMSVYNESERHLRQSIESILSQTYTNFEYLIVDDNPTEKNIYNILLEYSIDDSRIKLIINSKNLGLVNSLNIAIKSCNGQYVARMDADDIAEKDRLENQIKYLYQYDYDMIGSGIRIIDDKGQVIDGCVQFPNSFISVKRSIIAGNPLPHPTWFLKKDVYEKLNGYRQIAYCEDYDFVLRAIDKGFKLGNVNAIGLSYRIRQNGISNSNYIPQYLIRLFLYKNFRKHVIVSEENLTAYISSKQYEKDYQSIQQLMDDKKLVKHYIKRHKLILALKSSITLCLNRYFIMYIVEKIVYSIRNRK